MVPERVPADTVPPVVSSDTAGKPALDSTIDYDSLNRGELAKAAIMSVKTDSLSRIDFAAKEQLQQALSTVKEDDTFHAMRIKKRIDSITVVDSVRQVKKTETIDRLRANMKGFPVLLCRDTVFMVFMRYGPFTAQERAAAISRRLVKLGKRLLQTRFAPLWSRGRTPGTLCTAKSCL